MIRAEYLASALAELGVIRYAGVPCSYLGAFIEEISNRDSVTYWNVTSEGEAIAMAGGSWLGGSLCAVLCQNSGLGNAVNPLTSFIGPFKIPLLMFVTWRGHPLDSDAIQHGTMGAITCDLLDLLGIKWAILPDNESALGDALAEGASYALRERGVFAFVVKKNTFAPAIAGRGSDNDNASLRSSYPLRYEVLEAIVSSAARTSVVVATTGKTARELFCIRDDDRHVYCVGSMGYANAIAHGIACAQGNPVIVVDGDGAVLMHLGNLATIGAEKSENLVHIVIDNGAYDSTGGQPTLSSRVDLCGIARAVGYRRVAVATSIEDVAGFLRNTSVNPAFLRVMVRPGAPKDLVRPDVSPSEVADRLRAIVAPSGLPAASIIPSH